MVFEADLTTVKSAIDGGQYQKTLTDINALITKVENRYATLNAAQRRQWEPTRAELSHAREHILELVSSSSIESQRPRVRRILNNITVI
jgi:hypothetical protein